MPGYIPFSSRAGEEGLQGRDGQHVESTDFREGFQGVCGPVAAYWPRGAPGSLSTQARGWRAGWEMEAGDSW